MHIWALKSYLSLGQLYVVIERYICFFFFHQTKLYQLRARKFPNNAKTRKLLLQISKFVETGISVP